MKENAKHTPGPWTIGEPQVHMMSGWQFYPIGPTGNAIAVASIQDAHSDANAALIAAAPDLLAACEVLLDKADVVNTRKHAGLRIEPGDWSDMYDAANRARAALALAREVQP
jgi:hypothetical protein